jgi:hypothetical protein
MNTRRCARLAEEIRTLGRRIERSHHASPLGQRVVYVFALLQTLPAFMHGTATTSDASTLVNLVKGLIDTTLGTDTATAEEARQ